MTLKKYCLYSLVAMSLIATPVNAENLPTTTSDTSLETVAKGTRDYFFLFGIHGLYDSVREVDEHYVSQSKGLSKYATLFHSYKTNNLSFRVTQKPEWLSFDADSESFSGTPTIKDIGHFTITFDIIDADTQETIGQGETSVTVQPKNGGLPTLKNIYGYINKSDISVDLNNDFAHYYDWKVEGLPEGITFNPETLIISGTAKELGTAIVSISGIKKPNFTEIPFLSNTTKQFTITIVEEPIKPKQEVNNEEKSGTVATNKNEQSASNENTNTGNNGNTTKTENKVPNTQNSTENIENRGEKKIEDKVNFDSKTNSNQNTSTNSSQEGTLVTKTEKSSQSLRNANPKITSKLPRTGERANTIGLIGLIIVSSIILLKAYRLKQK